MTTVIDLFAAGWSDFVDPSKSVLVEGTDWRRTLPVVDANGDPVDMTGATYTCEVRDRVGGALLVTVTATGTPTGVDLSAPAAATEGIVPGESLDVVWECIGTGGGYTGALWAARRLMIKGRVGA